MCMYVVRGASLPWAEKRPSAANGCWSKVVASTPVTLQCGIPCGFESSLYICSLGSETLKEDPVEQTNEAESKPCDSTSAS